jgi:hypothetical protein
MQKTVQLPFWADPIKLWVNLDRCSGLLGNPVGTTTSTTTPPLRDADCRDPAMALPEKLRTSATSCFGPCGDIGCVHTVLPRPRSGGLHPPARIQASRPLRLECWLCYSDAASKAAGACPSPRWCSCSTLMKIHFVAGWYLFMCMSRCTELQTMQPLSSASGNSLMAFVLLIHATSKILVQSHQRSYYFLLIAACLLCLCLMIQKYIHEIIMNQHYQLRTLSTVSSKNISKNVCTVSSEL